MKLQDYIHYYIGCRCINTWFQEGHKEYNKGWVLSGYCQLYANGGKPFLLESENEVTWTDSINLILRRLEDITEDEFVNAIKIYDPEEDFEYARSHYPSFKERGMAGMSVQEGQFSDTMHVVHYLISIGVDMFGLIDAGLAIDSKTLK